MKIGYKNLEWQLCVEEVQEIFRLLQINFFFEAKIVTQFRIRQNQKCISNIKLVIRFEFRVLEYYWHGSMLKLPWSQKFLQKWRRQQKNPQAQGLRKRKECGGYSKVSSQVNFLVVGFMKTILTLEEYTEANLKAIFSLDLTWWLIRYVNVTPCSTITFSFKITLYFY